MTMMSRLVSLTIGNYGCQLCGGYFCDNAGSAASCTLMGVSTKTSGE